MSKTLLVLAASRYQIDAIQTAQRFGYRVITTDNVPSNPGHVLADRAYPADTTDFEAVLKVAKAERIDGIISPCTDVAVPTAAFVAEELGLPGPPLAAAHIVTDKIAFRHFLASHLLPLPRFHEIKAGEDMPEHLFENGASWIIKPDRSSGSKGIFIVRDVNELAARLPESRAFSPTQTVLVEEFLDGQQGTVEGVLKEGHIVLHFILDRRTAPPPFVTTTGHHLPSTLPESAQRKLLQQIESVWAELGVTDGVFDCDFVWSKEEIYLLEMTPRLGGNSISHLIKLASGVNLVEIAVQQAMGESVSLPALCDTSPTAVVLLGVWNEGHLQVNVEAADRLKQEPWVHSLDFDLQAGARVMPFINGRHRIGEAFIQASDAAALAQRAAELQSALQLQATA